MDEEGDVMLATELDLFTINTITLPESEILAMMVVDAIIGINAKINIDAKIDTDTRINVDMKINIDEPIFYFPHTPRKIQYTLRQHGSKCRI
jgi:hypothetical protein